MPNWLLKAAVQGTIAQLPKPHVWNRLLQRHITRSLDLTDEVFGRKWEQCRQHFEHYKELSADVRKAPSVLELGTGWYPLVPIGLFLLGAGRVWSVDLQRLVSRKQLLDALNEFAERIDGCALDVRPDRAARLLELANRAQGLSVDDVLDELQITLLIADARDCPLVDRSVDLFVSNNTFEHIPGEVLAGILREFRRVASPGAVMSHFIDMGDHYSVFDRSLSVFNFYRYPDWAWKYFNSKLQYQNRLRTSDFRDLYEGAGWPVAREVGVLGPIDELRSIPISRAFDKYTEKDLQTTHVWLLSALDEEGRISPR